MSRTSALPQSPRATSMLTAGLLATLALVAIPKGSRALNLAAAPACQGTDAESITMASLQALTIFRVLVIFLPLEIPLGGRQGRATTDDGLHFPSRPLLKPDAPLLFLVLGPRSRKTRRGCFDHRRTAQFQLDAMAAALAG